MAHFLRKSIGPWSGGTRVGVVTEWSEPESVIYGTGSREKMVDLADVVVLAGDRPILYGVLMSDLVERRKGERTIARGTRGGTESSSTEDTEDQED